MRRLFRTFFGLGMLVLITVLLINGLMMAAFAARISDEIETLAPTRVALVLGTSHWSANGHPSQHFAGRMDAAAELHQRGVVQQLLLSGANPEIHYNEPQRMREALAARGVPEEAMLLDYAGRRTLDSVRRARDVFNQRQLIIVSQPYHLPRALFLAQADGIEAVGFAAAGPPWRERWRTEWREIGARVLAVLDVYLLDTEPHFPAP